MSASPSQFQAIEIDWQSTSDALSRADAGVGEALKRFRNSGDGSLLRPALAARLAANDRMRTLMRAIWANPI